MVTIEKEWENKNLKEMDTEQLKEHLKELEELKSAAESIVRQSFEQGFGGMAILLQENYNIIKKRVEETKKELTLKLN